jgi:hypothetical protein
MNEFTANKLGEVLAFSTLGIETFLRAGQVLAPVFGAEELNRISQELKVHKERIEALSAQGNVQPQVLAKAEKIASKIGSMRDAYMGDNWDDAHEIMEWLGFFEGGAIVHWSLIEGAAGKENLPELFTLAQAGVKLHKEILDLTIAQSKK